MATYQFQEFELQIHSPNISIYQFIDNFDGTGIVCIMLSLGVAPTGTKFIIELDGFTYSSDPTHAEIEAWVATELVQYEV